MCVSCYCVYRMNIHLWCVCVYRYNIGQEQKLALETTILVESYTVSTKIPFYSFVD